VCCVQCSVCAVALQGGAVGGWVAGRRAVPPIGAGGVQGYQVGLQNNPPNGIIGEYTMSTEHADPGSTRESVVGAYWALYDRKAAKVDGEQP
jgi:hypothetical protein